MPASPDTFTVTCNGIGAIGIDHVDPNTDPDEDIVYAFVWFRPRLDPGTVIWASGLTPPRGIQLDDIKARFSPEDGKLRTIIAGPVNEKQTITITGSPTGGSWPLTFDGQTVTGIAHNAAPLAVQNALESLPNIAVGDVYISGAATNEKQTITIGGGATDGNFKIAFNGSPPSGFIPRNANSATVQGILQALSTIGSGGCSVTGAIGGPWTVEFTGPLAGADLPQMTGDATDLIGGTPTVNIATTVQGSSGGPYTVTFQGAYAGTDVPLLSSSGASLTPSGDVLIEPVTEGTQDLGVKLVANTSLIDLDELIYDIDFEIPESDRIIKPFAILAPTTTAQTVDLATVTKLPHRSELGI